MQETKVVTVEGNPPTGNEPWEICYGEYAQTSIDTNVDFDTFRFVANAGDVVRILINSPTGLDPFLQVFDPSGTLIDSASCSNNCSILLDMDPLAVGGIHTLLINDGGLNEGGAYTLSLERLLPETWIPWLPYNQTQSISIDYNTDHDWLKFVADAGSTVSIAVSSPTGLDPILDVYDPQGILFATDSCSNNCSFILDLPPLHLTGTYTMCFRDGGLNEGGVLQVTLNCIFHPGGMCPNPPPDGPLGVNYCSSSPNSTAAPAVMTARGSALISDNSFFLTATNVPIAQFGLFFFGPNQISKPLPPHSQGNLCVGGPLIRTSILMSCNDSTLRLQLDLDNLPQGQRFFPGETWNFQAWFRDTNPGSTSNTTDGLAVLFQ